MSTTCQTHQMHGERSIFYRVITTNIATKKGKSNGRLGTKESKGIGKPLKCFVHFNDSKCFDLEYLHVPILMPISRLRCSRFMWFSKRNKMKDLLWDPFFRRSTKDGG